MKDVASHGDEKVTKLKYFEIYTKRHCHFECSVEYIARQGSPDHWSHLHVRAGRKPFLENVDVVQHFFRGKWKKIIKFVIFINMHFVLQKK